MTEKEISRLRRQLVDIQVQADRIINGKPSFEEVRNFCDYSEELKAFIAENITEEMVLKVLDDIPKVDLTSAKIKAGLLGAVLGGIAGPVFAERQKIRYAVKEIRNIKDRYSSIEFLTKMW